MGQVPQLWIDIIGTWAACNKNVLKVYLFGSRVKGNDHIDSDLDIAVVVADSTSNTALGRWFALADSWAEELQANLPVKIDLQLGNADLSTSVVAPAVADHGMLIFERKTE